MRTLKFRAWDGFRKKMSYEPIISDGTDGGETSRVRINDAIDCFDGDLMQFTGLVDKNGREIYEGDVLKTDSGAHQFVKYRDDLCSFVCSFKKGASTNIDTNWVVIGNIYENPELLG